MGNIRDEEVIPQLRIVDAREQFHELFDVKGLHGCFHRMIDYNVSVKDKHNANIAIFRNFRPFYKKCGRFGSRSR